jgi:hypothetical protein
MHGPRKSGERAFAAQHEPKAWPFKEAKTNSQSSGEGENRAVPSEILV